MPDGTSFALQPIDEIDHSVKAASCAAADTSPSDGNRQMRFAGAGSADQHRVALLGKEGSARQIADQRLVDRRAAKSKSSMSLAGGSLAMVS